MPDPQGGWLGKPCPKCAYVRAPSDANPEWQCPRCQVAYAKVAASPVRARLAAEGREMVAEAGSDFSLVVLIAANLVALLVAYATKMSLRDLMLVYWTQSVVIGVANVIRILRLRRFSTEGITMNDRPLRETPQEKGKVALFFAIHYGFFHLGYLLFIVVAPGASAGGLAPLYVYAILALVFAANHAYSLRHNLERDARGRPNIGTLMFLPYARIVPMHLTILLGGMASGSTFAFFLFGLLKTAADVVMHVAEHHILGKQAGSAPANT